MKFADLHIHPSIKSFLSAEDMEEKESMREGMSNPIKILRSKSSIRQMTEGNVILAVIALFPLERALGVNEIIDFLVPNISKLNFHFLNKIFDGDYSYYELLNQEINHIKYNIKNNYFHLPVNYKDINPDQINLIFSIEGGHALEDKNNNLKKNLCALKSGSSPFLYLTLVHLSRYKLCTQAYGMKFIQDDSFKPKGKGLTSLGKEIIDLAYNEDKGRRILIDVKHMSLVSRIQFYRYRKEKQWENIPIIASHCGIAGISWSGIPKAFAKNPEEYDGWVKVTYKKPLGAGDNDYFSNYQTYFNPSTINLYDEEISEIIDSGGLIGLSLDQRVLGFGKIEEDYFTKEEFEVIADLTKDKEIIRNISKSSFNSTEEFQSPLDSLEEKVTLFRKQLHLRYLCNNILHILKIGGSRSWDHICLGSDFDGFINPVKNCPDISCYPQLNEELIEVLPKMYEEEKKSGSILLEVNNIRKKIENLMYNNLDRFLKKNF